MEVTQEKINEWKEKYTFVYRTQFDKDFYYFRTLTREDYKQITEEQTEDPVNYDYESAVVKKCLLSDYSNDSIAKKSGIVTVLSEAIMLRSGFQQVEIEEL